MGTATAKTADRRGVETYMSVSSAITCIEDMRALVAAHDAMVAAHPDLKNIGWEAEDTDEYMSYAKDYS